MLGAAPKAEQGGFGRRGSGSVPTSPQDHGLGGNRGAAQELWQGGLQRAAAAGVIRQKLICKENLATVRANIDFVFVCLHRA